MPFKLLCTVFGRVVYQLCMALLAQEMTDLSRANHRAYTASVMEMEVKEGETGYLQRKKPHAFNKVLREDVAFRRFVLKGEYQ